MIRTAEYDTIVALSTPSMARSALALVRLSGTEAIGLVAKMLGDPIELLVARGNSTHYADVLDVSGEVIDDAVIGVYRSPKSFTGEDVVEITCHGSDLLSSRIIGRLIGLGARQAEPGEFSRRAFFAGKIGLEDVELISAKVDAQSSAGLRGLELAIHEKYAALAGVYEGLIALVAQVDAEIDFGESDDVHIEGLEDRLVEYQTKLSSLIRGGVIAAANQGVFSVALVGPPNVGKSSLFNAILNFERSIVSPVAGTTRDYVEAFFPLGEYRVKLIDTAGLRVSTEATERRGIELGMQATQRADIVLRVTTPSDRIPSDSDYDFIVHNKSDVDSWGFGMSVSALTGQGIPLLLDWLLSQLSILETSLTQSIVKHSEIGVFQEVLSRLANLNVHADATLLSEDLRFAASRIGELLGKNVGEESLNYIFSKMCIGK